MWDDIKSLFGGLFSSEQSSPSSGYTYTNSDFYGPPSDLAGTASSGDFSWGDVVYDNSSDILPNWLSDKVQSYQGQYSESALPGWSVAAQNQSPAEYAYVNNDFYGPPSDMAAQRGGGTMDAILATMDKAGKFMNSPGGKFAGSMAGAGVSALDAMRRNKMLEKAMKKQEQMLAQRRAENMRYNEPLRLQMGRQAVAPQARQGESVWFKQNELPRAYAEGGYVMSDDELVALQQEARQAQADAQMDRPSALGFIKYMAAGKKMPSEIAAAKRARQQVATDPISVIRARQRALDEAAGYAEGGRYVRGGTAGQDDKVQALLSDGEYVMDADVVSALGDGNNEAGAARLDKMRENIRSHKRSAPAGKIPPKAKSPEAYLKKGK